MNTPQVARSPNPDDTIPSQSDRKAIKMPAETIAELSQIDTRRALARIAFEWGAILGAALLCHRYFNPFLYVLSVLWIGARQHAIGILLHEGCHKRLAKNRKLNYWIAEVLLAWPLFITFHGYEREHLSHHRLVGTDEDPDRLRNHYADYEFPKSPLRTCAVFAAHLLGLRAIRDLHNMLFIAKWARDGHRGNFIVRIGFYTLLTAAALVFDLWLEYLMYWLIPVCTVLIFLLYFRLLSEHFGLQAGTFMMTRNIDTNWLGRLFISPANVNYHLDHHLYPSVPFYNLPRLHEALLRDSYYARHALNVTGYFGDVLRSLTGRPHRSPQLHTHESEHTQAPLPH